MRLIAEANGYATPENAIKKLNGELARIGASLDDINVRWLISVNREGRYVPTIVASGPDVTRFVLLVHRGIAVVN